ncbi:MAG: shikimate dehydrogenase [Muribaculaceae bacterium]|nr:shikimate dehydrogenase [Muribaculaceae bacterium]
MEKNYSRLYGLIGYPLIHSFSQNYFNQKFEAEGIDAKYVNFEIADIGELMEVVSENANLCGLNVTIPYKEQVIPYLDEVDEDAAKIGAVNVIKFIRGKNSLKFKGYNSDIIGFCDSLKPLLKPEHKKALILGTGGAAKAVYHGLLNLGIEPMYVSRSKRDGMLTYGDLSAAVMNEYKVIVNTTPLGMYPHVDECPNIPYHLLTPSHLCYDLLYNPDVTLFMKRAEEQGAAIKNGLEMLLLQAFAAWNIWNTK